MPILTSRTQTQQSALLSKTALVQWVGGVSLAILCQSSFAGNCGAGGAGFASGISDCSCYTSGNTSEVIRTVSTGVITSSQNIQQCNASYSICNAISDPSTASTQYYKNMTAGATDYFSCDWGVSGFSNWQYYNSPPAPPPPISAPIDLIFGKQSQTFAAEINVK